MPTAKEYAEASKRLQDQPCPIPSFFWVTKKAVKTLKAKPKGKR